MGAVSAPPIRQPVLRAAFLRHLPLRLPLPDEDGAPNPPWPLAATGLRVSGARVEAALDLTDAAGPNGTPLPPLALEDCDISDPIDCCHARIARLSLRGSRIRHVRARHVRIEGTFDFSGIFYVWPDASDEHAVAWIDAHGCVIGGDAIGDRACLRAPPPRPAGDIIPGGQCYALRLSNCYVAGRLDLNPGVRAGGGVTVADGDIRGEAWLRGGTFVAGEGDAVRAQSTLFGSSLKLDHGFIGHGGVWLLGARIAGSLQYGDATFANAGGDALVAPNAEIGGDALLRREKFRADGSVSLSGARITRYLICDDATFANADGDALVAANAEIGGDVLLRHTTATGGITVWGAQIDRDLDATGGCFINPEGSALHAPQLRISGDLRLDDTTILGDLSFEDAQVAGRIAWDGMTFPRQHEHAGTTYTARSTRSLVNMRHLRAEAEWRASNPLSEVPLLIDLGGAHAATLHDDLPGGWGGHGGERGLSQSRRLLL